MSFACRNRCRRARKDATYPNKGSSANQHRHDQAGPGRLLDLYSTLNALQARSTPSDTLLRNAFKLLFDYIFDSRADLGCRGKANERQHGKAPVLNFLDIQRCQVTQDKGHKDATRVPHLPFQPNTPHKMSCPSAYPDLYTTCAA